MKIAVLSGKGGVGKSTVVASLAALLSRNQNIICADCDVTAPNLGLFFGLTDKNFTKREVSTGLEAELIENKCIKCGYCLDTCIFSAITWKNKPVFNRFLCEGCGSCQIACPSNAITLKPVKNGWIGTTETKKFPIVMGQMNIGKSGSGEIVALVLEETDRIAQQRSIDWTLIDAAAGISNQVITAARAADFIVAVTEPTPAALSDLKKTLSIVKHLGTPYGILINKTGINPDTNKQIKKFTKETDSSILGELPYNTLFIDALIKTKPVVTLDTNIEKQFKTILGNIMKRV
ncbi:ATP-binding protein [archaeon]|nr:ATP-binding protein [archaeon]